MGVLPLEFLGGKNAESLGLTGRERFAVEGLENGEASEARVTATPDGGSDPVVFTARTPRSRVPLAAQSRDEPVPYSLPASTTSGTPFAA